MIISKNQKPKKIPFGGSFSAVLIKEAAALQFMKDPNLLFNGGHRVWKPLTA
jgi:hypothetical protein